MDTEFIDELASGAPTPGGGGASAYCGAIAASLASMVANLTLGKARYSDIEDEVIGCLGRLTILRSRLVDLVEADALAFEPLALAYRMPKDTEAEALARKDAIQEGLVGACIPPISIMEALIDVLHECDFLAHHGSKMAISDSGACALIARSAIISASLNVYINAASMDDGEKADAYRSKADALIEEGIGLADGIYSHVAAEIGAFTDI